jgi:mono/diheme cytochrome c family protein
MQLRILGLATAALGVLLLWEGTSRPGPSQLFSSTSSANASARLTLHETRSSLLDLEVGGDLAGLAAGTIRYVTREDLLALPQITFTVSDDHNFTGPTRISGVALQELLGQLSSNPQGDLVVALCDDLYRAHYPRAYLEAHRPVLALLINGKDPKDWPKDSEGYGMNIGLYLISHEAFVPSFKVLGHAEQPQIPWGVVRLEFRSEAAVLGAIRPRGGHANDAGVQDGYRLAQQNCFRCHNMGADGGQKAGHPWLVLASWATASPDYFAAYVRAPKAKNPHAQMPGNPDYDDVTVRALISYFQTFLSEGRP